MKTKGSVLTKEERDVLILAAIRPNGTQLSNSEIAERIGVPVNRVKTIIHRSCLKLKARNRNEALVFAILKKGEINLNDVFPLDELAEIFSSLGPEALRWIAHLVRQELESGHLPRKDESITQPYRRQSSLLTPRERDVLILISRGLTNKDIADRLCMSTSAVRTFLYRACAKLGTSRRADAVVWAIKQGEISSGDISSLNELVKVLAPLGVESIEKMAHLLNQKNEHPTATVDS